VFGAVVIDSKQLPEKEIKFVYNLIKFPETLIPRKLWSHTSAEGYALTIRKPLSF
jgi:hypothetical protein